MDKQLRTELLKCDGKIIEKKLWEFTYIKHQQDRRLGGESFSIEDHIRAMVYSMLSANISWEKMEKEMDEKTGKILAIDEIFYQYSSTILLNSTSEKLADEIKKLGCASFSTRKQMEQLIKKNIPKLCLFEEKAGSVDGYYQKFIASDGSLKGLIKVLFDLESEDKMGQMGVALIAEYLKNVGYDLAKPDRHICRILGRDYLGCGAKKEMPALEVIDMIAVVAQKLGRLAAEIDFILWSYCAKDSGQICDIKRPKCEKCVVKNECKQINK